MTSRICKLCGDQFAPKTFNNWYCVKCKWKHYLEMRKQPNLKQLKLMEEAKIAAEKRVKEALEKHANWSANSMVVRRFHLTF